MYLFGRRLSCWVLSISKPTRAFCNLRKLNQPFCAFRLLIMSAFHYHLMFTFPTKCVCVCVQKMSWSIGMWQLGYMQQGFLLSKAFLFSSHLSSLHFLQFCKGRFITNCCPCCGALSIIFPSISIHSMFAFLFAGFPIVCGPYYIQYGKNIHSKKQWTVLTHTCI